MKRSKIGAALIVLLCGAEIVIAIAIGGAGVSALFGLEGALVGFAMLAILGTFAFQRRQQAVRSGSSIASPDG